MSQAAPEILPPASPVPPPAPTADSGQHDRPKESPADETPQPDEFSDEARDPAFRAGGTEESKNAPLASGTPDGAALPDAEDAPTAMAAPEPAAGTGHADQPTATDHAGQPDVEGDSVEVHDTRPEQASGAGSGDALDPSDRRTGLAGAAAMGALPVGERPHRELPRVMAVANQKGGVGKTTTTVNLGAALAEMGYRVLVIDLDPQGNATTGLGVDARNFERSMYDVLMRETPLEDCIEPTSVRNLFVAPATIDLAGVEIELVPAFSRELRLRKAIATVVDDFDFVIIDCPPSLGLITINGLAAAGEVLVPIQCEYYALEGLGQLLRNVHLVASNLNDQLEVSTIVLTMYDARTRLAVDVATEVRKHFAGRVCRSVIPRTIRLSEAPSFGQPITVFDPTSRGAVAYRELAKEVSDGAPKRAG